MRRRCDLLNAGIALISTALAFAAGPLAGPALAQGTVQQQMACQSDAMRLCGQFIPNVDTVKACMVKQIRNLSPDCRAQFNEAAAPKKVLNTPASSPATDRHQAM